MKKVLCVLVALLCLASSAVAVHWCVIDNAGLFSKDDVAEIEQAVTNFQIKTGYDFAVLTTDDYLGYKNMQAIADSFYVAENFGRGNNESGMLYYIDMNQRYPYVSTFGDMIMLFDGSEVSAAHDACHPFLASGEYKEAVLKMIECAAQAVID